MRMSPVERKDTERLKNDSGATRRALRRVLPPTLGEETAQPIVFYLAELFASTGRLRTLIDRLGTIRPSNRSAVHRTLQSIETQVYEVVERHRRQLKQPLNTAVKRLYAERSRQGS